MDKIKIIEKHILRYIFVHGKYEFKGEPAFELYKRLSQDIEKELNVVVVGIEDFNSVFAKLVADGIVCVKYEDENAIKKREPLKGT